MANTYPTSLNNYATGASSPTLAAAGHSSAHNNVETKLGTGSSTATNNTVLRGTGAGTSAWQQVALGTDVTGTLIVSQGGTGLATLTSGSVLVGNGTGNVTLVATTGSGNFVRATSPTLTTPVIATITNTGTLTLPTSTDTLVGRSTTDTLVNKTLTSPIISTISNTGTLTLPTSTDTLVGRATTDTLSNKRMTKRVVVTTQSATPTINTDNTDIAYITGLAQAITSFTTNLSGTPVNGDSLIISITDSGTARAITWGASFESSGNVTLPTTTVISTRLDVGFLWNIATSKWRCVAVA